jgi:hypothetical protein
MLNHERSNGQEILLARIRFALRRATGLVFDIDAMLRRPELRARRIETWRAVASPELNSLLDQLESELDSRPPPSTFEPAAGEPS